MLTIMRRDFLLLMFFFAVILPHASAQKLLNVQDSSLRAPAGVKIDGKANEWGRYKAYNKATGLYYIMANDDENLYLTVKADKPRIIEKIIDVGLTLIVNPEGIKSADAKTNIAVTYPLLDFAPGQRILWYGGAKVRSETPVPSAIAGLDTTRYSSLHIDSLLMIANHLMEQHAKTIKVTGATGIDDPVLSVYNGEGIKARARFDNAGAYIYELAVPLKYFGLAINDPRRFTYSLHLESRMTEPKHGMRVSYVYPNHVATDVDQDLDSTTDFWTYYTLAAK